MFRWLSRRKSEGNDQPKTGQAMTEVIDHVKVDNNSSQVPSDSLRVLLRTAIADAEKIAESIKASAEQEARAESSRIVAQAELEARKIREGAEIAAQQRAEAIIAEAKKQAEITGTELKHHTLQFLINASEEVKKEISKDYNEAYSRLSSSLQDIMTESENIERLFKDKVTNLWESKGLELKEFETALLGTSTTTSAETQSDSEPDTAEITGELANLEENPITETPGEPVNLEDEPITEIAGELANLAEELANLEENPIAEIAEEPANLKEETPAETVEEPVRVKNKNKNTKDTEKGERNLPPVIIGGETPFTGTIELSIASPVELNLVSKLYSFLQNVPELRILYTRGSWDKGTTITVVLEKTMPLIGILSNIPGVKVIAEMLAAGNQTREKSGTLIRGDGRPLQRIGLTLEEK